MNNSLKICFITQQYNKIRSGVGLYATNLVRMFSRRGIKMTVIVSDDSLLPTISLPHITFIVAKRSIYDPSPNKWVSFSKEASKIIKKMQIFDIYHYSDAREAFFHPLKKKQSKVIGNANDYFIADARLNALYYKKNFPSNWLRLWLYYNSAKLLEKRALKKIDHIISNTNMVKKMLLHNYRLSEKRFTVIYKSIDLEKINYISKNVPEVEINGEPILLCVAGGNFQKKGVETLIKILPPLTGRFPYLKLLVAGKDADEEKTLNYYKKTYTTRMLNHVEFIGNISNEKLASYYKKASLFVRPSFFEAFGVTYLEAMAYGVPAIGSTAGGTNELIENGKNGFLVDPNDSKALLHIILTLLQNKELYNSIVIEGLSRAKQFSLDTMFNKTLQLYKGSSTNGGSCISK
jgi:glycosyltransferase involved in cell wall biosynthesis